MKSHNRFGFKDVTNFFLEWVFAPVYALTITPFTVQLFRCFVTPPQMDIKLLNYFSLAQVHTFFLPIFVLTFELISVQVATGWWRNLFRKRLATVFALSLVFLLLQFFPTFSTYFSARLYELNQIQDKDISIESEIETNVRQQNKEAQRLYSSDLDRYQREIYQYNIQCKTIENQIAQEQGNIKRLSDQNNELIRNASQQLFTDNLTKSQVEKNRKLIDEHYKSLARAQEEISQLRGSQPAHPEQPKLEPIQVRSPANRKTDATFLIETWRQPNSLIAGVVSMVFPFIVFGAGYVLAHRTTDDGDYEIGQERAIAQLSLKQELEKCSNLSPEQQLGYVKGLQAVIISHIYAIRATKTFSITNTHVQLENEREMQILNALLDLRNQLLKTTIGAAAQESLNNYITNLIEKEPFKRKENN